MSEKKQYSFKSHKFDAIQLPKIAEKPGKEWIDFGQNNLYPELLIELYNNSAMHHTAIDAIVDGITGNGIKYHGDMIINSHGQTMDEVFECVVKDYKVFGGYSLNVIWARDGQTIAEIYHLPFNGVRSGVLNEDEKIEEYFYSSNWKDVRKYKPKSYKAFSTTDNLDDNASQIFYYFDYTMGQYYYPLPSWVAAINDIDTDARISRFHRSNIQSGLAPSMMLTFKNGIPTVDEQDEIYRDIKSTFAGEENAGKFFVNFCEPGREPTLEAIENSNDDYYILLEERLTSRIMTAHRITSGLLLGIKDASGFSSNAEEITTAYNHFMGTVIIPDQKKLLKSFNKIINLSGRTLKLEIEPAKILYTIDVDGTNQQIEPNNTEQ